MSMTHDDLKAVIARAHIERVNPDACSAAQIEKLSSLTAKPPADLVIYKDGSRSLVGKHTLSDGTDCVLKYYYPKNLAKKINYALRGSRAKRSWVAAIAFEALGIPTAPAMMLHEKKSAAGLMLQQSMLACHVAPGIPLIEVTDESALQEIAPQLEEAFTTMTSHRISHGDLKARNIIVGADNRIRFIDLDGTTFLSPETKWRSLWQRDRARFLKNWAAEHPAHAILSGVIKPAES